jgi:hypothetical protein
MWEFRFTGCVAFQLQRETLNAFNRTQFGAPVTNPVATNFGALTVQSQTNKRSLQFMGRITF